MAVCTWPTLVTDQPGGKRRVGKSIWTVYRLDLVTGSWWNRHSVPVNGLCPRPVIQPDGQLMGTDSKRRMQTDVFFSRCCFIATITVFWGCDYILNKAVSSAQLRRIWWRCPELKATVALPRQTRQTRSPARSTSAKYATTTSTWTDALPDYWVVHTPSVRNA